MKRFIAIALALGLLLAATTLVSAETQYYKNTDNWDGVNAYAWEPNEQFGSWPGSACTDEGDGWWSIETDYAVGNHIIFNNEGEGSQNSDLELEEGKIYFFGSRETDEGALTYEEAVEMFGWAPGGDDADVLEADEIGEAPAPDEDVEEDVVEEDAAEEPVVSTPAEAVSPPLGEASYIYFAVFMLLAAGGLLVYMKRRIKA
jgi:alpha-amylase